MIRKGIKFVSVITLSHFVTYYVAGVIAQVFLGAKEFYPPSPNAIVYLKDPHNPSLQMLILPAQLLRGLLFGLVLLPLYPRLIKLGMWKGSFLVGAVILATGYLAASGGLIEHVVYFKPEHYPIDFAIVTLVEIMIQTLLLSLTVLIFFRKEFAARGE